MKRIVGSLLLVLIILIVVPCCADEVIFKPSGSFLAEVTDPSKQWVFKNDNGYLGIMKFGQDGSISGYDHPNQRYWRIENGAFTILNKDKVATCRFVQIIQDYSGKWHAQGMFIGSSNGWRHYLEQV